MKNFNSIIADIKRGNYKNNYFLYGEEPYFIDAISRVFEENVIEESMRDFNQAIVYGGEISSQELLDILSRYPMMSDKQLVVLKEAHQMKNFEQIGSYFDSIVDTTIFIINWKSKGPDKRKKEIKRILSQCEVIESKPLYDNQVPSWIVEYCQDRGYKMLPKVAFLLSQYLGNNLGKIVNELSKIFLNIPEKSEITSEHIEKYIGISKDYNIFELQKTMSLKDFGSLFRIVKYFKENSRAHPIQMIIATLNGYFTKLLIIKSLQTKNEKQVAAAIGISPFFVKEYLQADRNYTQLQIHKNFEILLEYDLKSKGVNNNGVGQEDLLEEMMIQLMS